MCNDQFHAVVFKTNIIVSEKNISSQFSSVLVLVEMAQHIITHGDAVKDIAFAVDDLDGIVEVGMDRSTRPTPWTVDGEKWLAGIFFWLF